jgi:hypothetical protein
MCTKTNSHMDFNYKYYVFGHYPSSCLYLECPVSISKHVSETGFCLRLKVKPTQLGPIDRASPYLRTNWIGFTWRWRQNPVSEKLCFERKTGRHFR